MSGLQLTPPFTGWGAAKRPTLGGGTLKLDPPFTVSRLGWVGRTGQGQVLNLFPALDPIVEDSVRNACWNLARAAAPGGCAPTSLAPTSLAPTSLSPTSLAPSFLAAVDPGFWTFVAGILKGAGEGSYRDVPTPFIDPRTGRPYGDALDPSKPASIGKIVDGALRLNDATGAVRGSMIDGFAIVGKKFPAIDRLPVHLLIGVDPSALTKDGRKFFSGAGVQFQPTPWLKLTVGAGVDGADQPGGFFTISIGADPAPTPPPWTSGAVGPF